MSEHNARWNWAKIGALATIAGLFPAYGLVNAPSHEEQRLLPSPPSVADTPRQNLGVIIEPVTSISKAAIAPDGPLLSASNSLREVEIDTNAPTSNQLRTSPAVVVSQARGAARSIENETNIWPDREPEPAEAFEREPVPLKFKHVAQ
jgi:hypothetical protein